MRVLLIAMLIAGSLVAGAQEIPSFKFGKISAEEISTRSYAIDTNAAAVVLADIGSSKIVGNNKGWFSLEFKLFRRIHILKNAGFENATVEIQLYSDGEDEEKLDDLKAVTYNVENGKVVESKLNVKNAVFKEKLDKNTVQKKFTLSNVKEGSVIEYSYTVTSDFLFNIQPWNFQGDIPRLWSQYTVSLPPFMNYMLIPQISLPYAVADNRNKAESYVVEVKRENGLVLTADRFNISCQVTDFRWGMKNVPAFHEEAYTSTPRNYIERLEFQLAGYLAPLTEQKIITTWPDLTDKMLKRDDFGATLSSAQSFWPAELETIVKKAKTQRETAELIFSYVRDRFTCTDYSQLYIQESLKKVVEKKSGGVAELNLLLTAFLKYAGLSADPVILSSRGHMYVNDSYPVVSRFNYVISRVIVGDQEIYLDASRPQLGFGKLHYSCYNGTARLVDASAAMISLRPDMITETSRTNIQLIPDKGGKWTGSVNRLYGYFSSEDVRKKFKLEGAEGLSKEVSTFYNSNVSVSDMVADSMKIPEEPVQLHYTIRFDTDSTELIYFNPVLGGVLRHNPFKSVQRRYPVEMPYKISELYTLSMELPSGYTVEELPKSITYKMNTQGDAIFEYKISQSGGYINMLYRLDIKRSYFSPEEYEILRAFFGNMVSKMEEQIVLKKK
jgi:hypothetical protein